MSQSLITWLEAQLLGSGGAALQQGGGVPLPRRSRINFLNASLVDDPGNDSTDIAIVLAGDLYTLDAGSAALTAGDYVCPLPGAGRLVVTRATAAALAAAGGASGMVLAPYSPGATNLQLAIAGTVDPSIVNLGTGAAGPVIVTNGRPARPIALRQGDAGFRGGSCDTHGKVTIELRGRGATSAHHEYNVLDYGAVPDAELALGSLAGSGGTIAATDNLAAFNAAVAAIQASGVAGVLRIPAGTYYLAGMWDMSAVTVPIHIVGDEGDAGGAHRGTSLVFPVYNYLTGGTQTRTACIQTTKVGGSSLRHINIWQAYSQGWAYWKAGLYESYNLSVLPSKGSIGVEFHGTSTSSVLTVTEPNWGKRWDELTFYRVGDTFWSQTFDATLNPNGIPYQYQVTAATGDQRSPLYSSMPTNGPIAQFVAGASYANGQSVRPTNANWNGCFYTVTAGSGVVAAEPNWASAPNAGNTVTVSGVTFTNGGTMLPMSAGLTTTLTTSSGSLSIQLANATGQFSDPNTGGTAITWEVRSPIAAVFNPASTLVEFCQVNSIHGDGRHIYGATGTPSDAWRDFENNYFYCSRHGIFVEGGDANIGLCSGSQIFGAGDTYVYEAAFLGNKWEAMQTTAEDFAHPGIYAYRVLQYVCSSEFTSCYTEGGVPPAYLSGGQIINRQGAWTFFPDQNIPGGATEDSAIYHGPRSITCGPKGQNWAAGVVAFVGDYVYPNTPNGYLYERTAVTGTLGTTKTAVEPTWPTTVGATVTETGVGGNITYQCVGTYRSTVVLGNDLSPWAPIRVTFTDFNTGSPSTPHEIDVMYWGAPIAGVLGIGVLDENPSTALLGLDFTNGQIYLPSKLWLGYPTSNEVHFSILGRNDQAPTTTNDPQVTLNTGQSLRGGASPSPSYGDHTFWWPISRSGGGDVYAKAGKVYSDAEEIFRALRLTTGGASKNDATVGNIATPYAVISADGDVCVTTNATQTTLHTLDGVPTHALEDVVVKVIAETVDASNNPDGVAQAVFLLQGSCKESAGALVNVQAPTVLYGQPTDATHNAGGNSANWRAVIDFTASNTPRVLVTGFGTDRVLWKCRVEPMR